VIAPPGYERLLLAHAVAVARSDAIAGIRSALVGAGGGRSTLHEFAASRPQARALKGRGTAWAIALPGGPRVVVRHNRHGGAFAALTGDRFLSPTRAPQELAISLALRDRGVPTPGVVAYVLYPPGRLIQRADVATAEIPDSLDLASVLERRQGVDRDAVWEATASLVAALAAARARHPDLNAKNVLLGAGAAHVIDVDRVILDVAPDEALNDNLARLARSLRKRREQHGAAVTDAEIAALESRARALASRR
jgi:3-deoxy-D-manno-octulosonic acid kinase